LNASNEGAVVELTGAEDDDQWRVVSSETSEYLNEYTEHFYGSGNIKFATSCLWKFTVRATSSNPESTKYIVVYHGLFQEVATEASTGGESADIVIDLNALGLMGSQYCGRLRWNISAQISNIEEPAGELLIEIVDVTFGPPV
jgi:hypothetical protein